MAQRLSVASKRDSAVRSYLRRLHGTGTCLHWSIHTLSALHLRSFCCIRSCIISYAFKEQWQLNKCPMHTSPPLIATSLVCPPGARSHHLDDLLLVDAPSRIQPRLVHVMEARDRNNFNAIVCGVACSLSYRLDVILPLFLNFRIEVIIVSRWSAMSFDTQQESGLFHRSDIGFTKLFYENCLQ
jgi:hypothetical protein